MKSKIILGVLFLFALISLFLYIFYRQYAFPEHSIQFSINEHEAQAKAEILASQLEFGIPNYRKVTLFEIDDTAKSYLERELGPKETGELARSQVNLWYFTTRLFQTQQQEELYVSYAPDGRLVYFSHELDENLKGAALSKEQARQVARRFLSSNCSLCQRTNFPDGWDEVQYSGTSRKNRLDHSFVFERQNYALKEARQRVSVELAGDKVIGFNEYLKVPRQWISEFRKEKSYNDVAQLVAELISTFCITLPLIVIFFKKFKGRKLLFRVPYIAAIVLSAISLSEIVNSFFQYYFNYPTTQSPVTILVLIVFGLALTWMFTFITNQATLAVAEGLFREVFPKEKHIMFTVKNMLQLPSVTKGIFVGACVGIIFFLYELLYYFLGRQIGFWVPAEINYSDAFNSIAPWLYPLTIGLLPAVTEEVTYRLFGISLYTKFISHWLKNPKHAIILASVLSSFTWSFLHSAYPQMPFFVRGIELGVVGFAFSWLFLRYGILSSIAAL